LSQYVQEPAVPFVVHSLLPGHMVEGLVQVSPAPPDSVPKNAFWSKQSPQAAVVPAMWAAHACTQVSALAWLQ
jgi:hypothetical protein